MAKREKKTIYNNDNLLISSIFLQSTNRRCSFLYTGIIDNNDREHDYYVLGTSDNTSFRKNDSSFSLCVIRIKNKDFKQRVRDFFKNTYIDISKDLIINMKNVGAFLNKVKWDTSKLEKVVKDDITYIKVNKEIKNISEGYEFYYSKMILTKMFKSHLLFFDKPHDDIDVFYTPYDLSSREIEHVKLRHNGRMKKIPVITGLDNIVTTNIPADIKTMVGFLVMKMDSNNVYKLTHVCNTKEFDIVLGKSNLLLF